MKMSELFSIRLAIHLSAASVMVITLFSGLTYLNGLFDLLKDLVFHVHSVNGKSKKTVSMDFSSSRQDM